MSMVFVQALANSMGYQVVTCNTAVMRIDGFAMMPNFTFGMAIATFVGQNIGADKMDRVAQGTKDILKVSLTTSFVLVACLLLFFIGAPLGAIIRKGGIGIPLTTCILIFVFYWVTSTIGERMSRLGIITTSVGMWIASFILLILGIFLVYKASKESRLLDMEIWMKQLDRIKNIGLVFKNRKK